MKNIEQYRKRFNSLLESTMGDVKPLISEQETTGTTQTISQMLQGKEFPGLTKQEQDDTIYYSLFDPTTKSRLWMISFRVSPAGHVATKLVSYEPKYSNMVETMYNSLNGFQTVGNSQGRFDKSDPEMVFGEKHTKVDGQEVGQIFDTLVKSYNSIPKQ